MNEQEKKGEKEIAHMLTVAKHMQDMVMVSDCLIENIPNIQERLDEMNAGIQAHMKKEYADPMDQERIHAKANIIYGFSQLVTFRMKQRELEDRIKLSEEARNL